ncbi:MAG: FimV/HubP family polar landmark protein [Limnobacter sp.]|nr:FimV/HubP family polar landmark protein [Limnobacter sp.]
MIRYKTKLLPLLISALFVSIPSVEAAQLGKITVVSKPDQNFAAQILVERVLPGERESMRVSLAAPEAFAAARLTVDPNLSKLKFAIRDGAAPGTALIDVSSSAPIPAGFIDALLELSWAGGKVTREYTLSIPVRTTTPSVTPVLPEVSQPKSVAPATPAAPVSPAAPAAAPAVAPKALAAATTSAAPGVAAPKPQVTAAPSPAPAPVPAPVEPVAKADVVIERTQKVKRGNTLSEIAVDLVGQGVTLNQAMAALFEANPEAFINGSIHLLKPGAELRIPNRSSLRSRSKNDALVILAGGDDRNDFALAARQLGLLTVAKQEDLSNKQQSSGQIEQGRAKQTAPGVEQDRLKIAPGVTDGNAKAKLDRAAEELIAKEKSLAEANERIALLERNVSDLQRLLELQNKAGAGAGVAQGPAQGPAADPNAAQPNQPVAETPAEASAENKGETPAEVPTEAPTEAPTAAPPLAVEQTPDPAPKSEPSESEDSSLMSNPWVLGGGVGVSLAFLGGLVLLLKKRKKVEEPQEDDSEDQNAESFNEALAWATGTGSADEAPSAEPPAQAASRVEDEVFDLDEILSETPAPTPAPTPAVTAEPVQPSVPEAFERAPQVAPAESSPVVDLDFEPSEVDTKADVSSIFDDLDDLEKGAEAAKKEIEELRESTQATMEPEPEVEDVEEEAKASPASTDPVSDLDDLFDQAAAGLDLDLPGVELDAATRQEVDTKLDLAGAYVEIGDSDGASDLLKEIIEKGDAAQVKKAKELLASLK